MAVLFPIVDLDPLVSTQLGISRRRSFLSFLEFLMFLAFLVVSVVSGGQRGQSFSKMDIELVLGVSQSFQSCAILHNIAQLSKTPRN